MEETVLKAMERSDKPNRLRRNGWIPGVLNERDTTSTSVQFDAVELNKTIARHGSKAKLWIEIDGEKKFGLIKEVQTNPVKGVILHVLIQVVPQDMEVKLSLPIVFHGRENIRRNMLQVQALKNEIEVLGKATLMPDVVSIDVSDMELDDTVTAKDFNLDPSLQVVDPEDEVYAVIKAMREIIMEEPAEEGAEMLEEEGAEAEAVEESPEE